MPSIGAYTTAYNCFAMHYPFREAIQSWLGFADEVVVVDAGSQDGTFEELQRIATFEPRLRVYREPVDFSHPRWAIQMDGLLKAKSRAKCRADFLWQVDTDEIVTSEDFERIRMLPEVLGEAMNERPVVFMPMVEFWGSLSRIRADFLSWKPRFSKNLSNITHGIPIEFRMVDKWGNEYPRPYESDSCNYIWKDSRESVPMLFPMKLPRVALKPEEFDQFFQEALQRFPSVLHLSWLDLKRKISHYRAFWPKFHASMYNLDEPDTPERNVMFTKRWSDVTDEDIALKADELNRLGPRFFSQGKKHDPNKTGPTVPYRGPIPESLRAWATGAPA